VEEAAGDGGVIVHCFIRARMAHARHGGRACCARREGRTCCERACNLDKRQQSMYWFGEHYRQACRSRYDHACD